MTAMQVGTVQEIRALAVQLNAAGGYPRKGKIVGKRLPVQASWDGQGAVPYGWIAGFVQVLKFNASSQAGFVITPRVSAAAARAGVTLVTTEVGDVQFATTFSIDVSDRPARPAYTLDEARERFWGP